MKGKYTIHIIVILVFLLFLAGCNPTLNEPVPEEPDPYPVEVMDALETMQLISAAYALSLNDEETYLIASAPGSTINIDTTRMENGGLFVELSISPKMPDNKNDESSSYDVSIIPDTYNFYTFWVNGEVYPQVETLDHALQVPYGSSESIIVFDPLTQNQGVLVTGIVRVYEATLHYRLEDSDGNAVLEDYVNAFTGGPDWGYFSIQLFDTSDHNNASGSWTLQLMEEDAQDGGKRILYSLPINF